MYVVLRKHSRLYIYCIFSRLHYIVAEVNLDIMKKYRTLNYDYHNVGWYQSTHLGSHVDKNFLENQLSYQSTLEESVVLVYGQWLHDSNMYIYARFIYMYYMYILCTCLYFVCIIIYVT